MRLRSVKLLQTKRRKTIRWYLMEGGGIQHTFKLSSNFGIIRPTSLAYRHTNTNIWNYLLRPVIKHIKWRAERSFYRPTFIRLRASLTLRFQPHFRAFVLLLTRTWIRQNLQTCMCTEKMHIKVRCIKYVETNNKINTVYPI